MRTEPASAAKDFVIVHSQCRQRMVVRCTEYTRSTKHQCRNWTSTVSATTMSTAARIARRSRLLEDLGFQCLLAEQPLQLAHLASPTIRGRHHLFAAAGSPQRPPTTNRRQVKSWFGQRHVGEPPSLPSCPARRSPRPSEPSQPLSSADSAKRSDDLNSIRRIAHRHGCMPHTC